MASGAALPALPPRVPKRRHPIAGPVGRAVLGVLGWRFTGGFADYPRQVLVLWPHTSNWDGLIGLAGAAVVGLEIRFLAKRALFRPPLGWLLRHLGGVPVERGRPGGLVGQAVARFEAAEASGEGLHLAILPEGTRARGEAWKMGFHRIATQAGVPVAVVGLDYRTKRLGVIGTVLPSGDVETDLAAIAALLADVRGKHHEKATPPRAPEALPPPPEPLALGVPAPQTDARRPAGPR